MKKFATLLQRAEQRRGGSGAVQALLPSVLSSNQLQELPDDRILSAMARCIHQAGFNWTVIDNKWPQFEEAYLNFDVDRLAGLPAERWEAYVQDVKVVRNWQKISALRHNVDMIRDLSVEHGGFGRFLARWPASDQVGLMRYLKQHGSRLGGQTSQWFFRFIGKDGFVLTDDVVAALQEAGLDVHQKPSSQRDLGAIQVAFNEWHDQTGLPFAHLSKICACSIGSVRDY